LLDVKKKSWPKSFAAGIEGAHITIQSDGSFFLRFNMESDECVAKKINY
jgi:hypothetical protein